MSDSLWPHGLQHARLPCPSPSPRACSNSCPLSWWCYLTISSFAALFSFAFNLSHHQSLFQLVGLHIRWPKYWNFSFSISLSNEYSKLISFRIDWLDLPVVEGILKIVHQHRSSSRRWVDLNPARNQNLCHQCQAWVKLQLALCLLLLMILQFDNLLPPLLPLVSNSSSLLTWCQPLYASCCIVLLHISRYCTVKLKMFSLFFMFVCFFAVFVWKVLSTYYSTVLYSQSC